MLSLWKKVLEKRTLQENKEANQINTMDPRYDGPLSGYIAKINGGVQLEKCRLTPNLKDIFENQLACNYFKQYLESKSLLPTLKLLEIMERILKYQRYEESNIENCHSNYKTNNNNSQNISSPENGSPVYSNAQINLHDEWLKLPDDLKIRLQLTRKFVDISELSVTETNEMKQMILNILEEYWNEFCRSEWYYRYQVELLTSRTITLGDIMQHDTAFSYFMEFLEHEACQSVVEFWLAATNFEQFILNSQRNSRYDSNQALNDAISIYEKYLSLQATCPLGFSDNVRYAVEEAMCDDSNGPHFDCFHPAISVVLSFLRSRCLPSFFSSQHYVRLLSDTIGNSPVVTRDNHSPASSISEYSIDSKQPLLYKQDPDSIWRYRKQSGLSFGHIDQFGRFQRNIEPDPDKKSGSKITRAVKKWVQKTENKVQEEMAWQVAEMVVKDITNLTMGCHIEEDDEDDEYEGSFNK